MNQPTKWVEVPVPATPEMIAAAFAGLIEDQDCLAQERRRAAMGKTFVAMVEAAPVKDECKPAPSFQARVQPWMMECFGLTISADRQERNHRFLEESLELVQTLGATASEAHQLVDYVYGRPAGDPVQEVGGVMVTLAALCLANGMNMHAAGETELARIWTKVEQIRAKQAAKPAMSPLPGVYPERASPAGERNQCDGCQAGIPVVNGVHRMGKPGGYADLMGCTAKLYKPACGSDCNQIREESGLPTNYPCKACGRGACIDR